MVVEFGAFTLAFLLSPVLGALAAMLVTFPLDVIPDRHQQTREFLKAVCEGALCGQVGWMIYATLGASWWLFLFMPLFAAGMVSNDWRRWKQFTLQGSTQLARWEVAQMAGHPVGICALAILSVVQ